VPETTQAQRRAGFSIHVLTASGAVAGLIALQSVSDGHIRPALMWLIVCQILDGIDGPIARKFDVSLHAPHIDGHVLDLVIDYVTCVVVPTVLLVRLDVVAPKISMTIAGLILMSSALWFARTDQETTDVWFNGFPAMWNIVIPTLIILNASQRVSAVICVLFCISQLTTIKFPHLVRVRALRAATYIATSIYFGTFILLSAQYPGGARWAKDIILIGPIYLVVVVVWRTWFPSKSIGGVSILGPQSAHHTE
jgi:phosphatidylcholine synthase